MNLKLHSTQASRDLWWAPRSTERVRWPLWCREKCQLSQRPIFHYPKSFQKVRRVGERKVLCVSWLPEAKKGALKAELLRAGHSPPAVIQRGLIPLLPRSVPVQSPRKRALGAASLRAPPVRNVHSSPPSRRLPERSAVALRNHRHRRRSGHSERSLRSRGSHGIEMASCCVPDSATDRDACPRLAAPAAGELLITKVWRAEPRTRAAAGALRGN